MAQSQWREILRGFVIHNPDGKENVARVLGVSPRTIDRWIAKSSTTDPERKHISKLANVVPGREEEMRLSLKRDYPDAFDEVVLDRIMIPSAFYQRPIAALVRSARNVARPTVRSTIMKEIATHLDPNKSGIMILFAQCVKPVKPDGQVTSLHFQASGYGTGPWQYKQIEKSFFAGDGSLCAMAIVRGDIALFPQDIARINYTAPVLHGKEMRSCAAFPVLREGDIAGALFVASIQSEFFIEARRDLIADYVDLFAALGLRDNEFYPPEKIALQPLPSAAHQNEIYLYAQRFLDDLAQKFPDDTPEQREERARQIFHEECNLFRKDSVHAE